MPCCQLNQNSHAPSSTASSLACCSCVWVRLPQLEHWKRCDLPAADQWLARHVQMVQASSSHIDRWFSDRLHWVTATDWWRNSTSTSAGSASLAARSSASASSSSVVVRTAKASASSFHSDATVAYLRRNPSEPKIKIGSEAGVRKYPKGARVGFTALHALRTWVSTTASQNTHYTS